MAVLYSLSCRLVKYFLTGSSFSFFPLQFLLTCSCWLVKWVRCRRCRFFFPSLSSSCWLSATSELCEGVSPGSEDRSLIQAWTVNLHIWNIFCLLSQNPPKIQIELMLFLNPLLRWTGRKFVTSNGIYHLVSPCHTSQLQTVASWRWDTISKVR